MLVSVAALALAGCTSHARTVPPVAAEPEKPPEKTWLDQTAESPQHVADQTWNVVSAPVRWVTPKKQVAATRPVYDAPDVIIMQNDADGSRTVIVPLAEEPATHPAMRPATQPKGK